MNLDTLIKKHQELFNANKIVKVQAPARINIIGEHIDYLGGLVLPANVNLYMYGIFSKAENIAMYSENFNDLGIIQTENAEHFTFNPHNEFMNYALGCVEILRRHNYPIGGFHLSIASTIPCASGLSSSAAFGVMMITGLAKLYGHQIDNVKKAVLFKEVENNFMHLKNGIMDQFVIANGSKDHLMCLNTSTLQFTNLPIHLGEFEFVIFNSKRPRNLISSKYNERVEETAKGLEIINQNYNFAHVCDIPYELQNDVLELISDPVIAKRIRYAIEEQHRVKNMLIAIKNNDYILMGRILNEGHHGVQYDYEISCPESDFIQSTLRNLPDVLGARMTGAGFGGCLIALVNKKVIPSLNQLVIKPYNEKFHHGGEMYQIEVVDCAKIID